MLGRVLETEQWANGGTAVLCHAGCFSGVLALYGDRGARSREALQVGEDPGLKVDAPFDPACLGSYCGSL